MSISKVQLLEITDFFDKIKQLSNKKFGVEIQKKDLYTLQIYSTRIGVIPHNNKEKLIRKITLKLKKKIIENQNGKTENL